MDDKGNILDFPGFTHEKLIKVLARKNRVAPVIEYRTYFREEPESGLYRMEWTIQPDGRYWEDEYGYGRNADEEIILYAYLNNSGCFITPFRIYSFGGEEYIGTYQEEKLERLRRKREIEGRNPKESLRKSVKESFKFLLKNLKQQISEGKKGSFSSPDFGVPCTGNEACFSVIWFYGTKKEQLISINLEEWPLGAGWRCSITAKRGTPEEVCAWLRRKDSVEETAREVRSFSREVNKR